ncbi:MAG: hypothetical protein HY586_04225 [Candidatus Omnitrophica bacterium]|nr:hypothetical protein [Candidatus Omnitrophota bacterium]
MRLQFQKISALFISCAVIATQIFPSQALALSPPSAPRGEIIFISDLHADEASQLAVEKILQEITERETIDFIALEGGWGRLTPEALDFVRDPAQNRRVLLHILRHGELTGAELFAAQSKSPIPCEGAEEKALFAKYFFILEKILSRQSEVNAFLQKLRAGLLDEAHKTVNKNLREFLLGEIVWEESRVDLIGHVRQLEKFYLQTHPSKLSDIRNQFQYPNILRMLALSKVRDNVDNDFPLPLFKGEGTHFSTRSFLESLWDQAQSSGRPLQLSRPLKNHLRFRILQEELEARNLLEEIKRLRHEIALRLAVRPKEKKFLRTWRKAQLLAKLLRLELSQGEWEGIRKSKVENQMEEIVLASKFRFSNFVFRLCLDFYRGAQLRDRAMARNMERLFQSRNAKKAILVAGGFHKEPLERLLRARGFSVRTVEPNFYLSSQEGLTRLAGKMHSIHYQNAILNRSILSSSLATMPDELKMKPAGEFLLPVNFAMLLALAKEKMDSLKIKKQAIASPASSSASRTVSSRRPRKLLKRSLWIRQFAVFAIAGFLAVGCTAREQKVASEKTNIGSVSSGIAAISSHVSPGKHVSKSTTHKPSNQGINWEREFRRLHHIVPRPGGKSLGAIASGSPPRASSLGSAPLDLKSPWTQMGNAFKDSQLHMQLLIVTEWEPVSFDFKGEIRNDMLRVRLIKGRLASNHPNVDITILSASPLGTRKKGYVIDVRAPITMSPREVFEKISQHPDFPREDEKWQSALNQATKASSLGSLRGLEIFDVWAGLETPGGYVRARGTVDPAMMFPWHRRGKQAASFSRAEMEKWLGPREIPLALIRVSTHQMAPGGEPSLHRQDSFYGILLEDPQRALVLWLKMVPAPDGSGNFILQRGQMRGYGRRLGGEPLGKKIGQVEQHFNRKKFKLKPFVPATFTFASSLGKNGSSISAASLGAVLFAARVCDNLLSPEILQPADKARELLALLEETRSIPSVPQSPASFDPLTGHLDGLFTQHLEIQALVKSA